MQVNSIDVCVQGFERLRTRREFILATPIDATTTRREAVDALMNDWRATYRDIQASDDEVSKLLIDAIGHDEQVIDPHIEPRGENDDPCYIFVYIEA